MSFMPAWVSICALLVPVCLMAVRLGDDRYPEFLIVSVCCVMVGFILGWSGPR